MSWEPKEATAEWLNWALETVNDLPYTPTARYIFYRVHDQFGMPKAHYKTKFLPATSKARKSYWNGWEPDTLADDTREIVNPFGRGFTNPFKWFEAQAKKRPLFEIADHQDELVIVCFEAAAMKGQFEHYLDPLRIPMCAFRGDASIPFKYEIAELLDEMNEKWPEKEISILYFGDYDKKGLEIPVNAMRDIESWTNANIEFIRCGINIEHIAKYEITDSLDNPNKFQWEAVPDEAAKELILTNVAKHWDADIVRELRHAERTVGDTWTAAVKQAIAKAKKELGDLELDFPETDEEETEED